MVQTVADSSTTACLNQSPVEPKFIFFLSPSDVGQRDFMNITWQPNADGPVNVLGLIPGGQSFEIANITDGATGFEWQADIRAGTQVLLVAGDDEGLGTGGSTDVMDVGDGSSECIDDSSPSSTTSPPAGGVSSSSTNIGGSNPTSTGGKNTGTTGISATGTVTTSGQTGGSNPTGSTGYLGPSS